MVAFVYLHLFKKRLFEKNIWLICEKKNEARDNGYHFFRYLRKEHPEVNAFYVITKHSPDINKVKSIGCTIEADSFRHMVYYLACEKSISSQAYGAFPGNIRLKTIKRLKRLCNKNQITVFLQHGIIKDELSHEAFDYGKCNIDFFVTSSDREYDFIKEKYFYPDINIGRVGLCRFDNLKASNKREKTILIMPTWRMWLGATDPNSPPTKKEALSFLNSQFYNTYKQLLTDESFLKAVKSGGYKVVFYLHYQIQKFAFLFDELANDKVFVAKKEEWDVQDLLIESSILITDYSSVYFDFAYMDKPLIYYHFDRDRFIESHYKQGYFDYEEDGFGPVYVQHDEVVNECISIIERSCTSEQKYIERSKAFFGVKDANNCERTYRAIIKLTK